MFTLPHGGVCWEHDLHTTKVVFFFSLQVWWREEILCHVFFIEGGVCGAGGGGWEGGKNFRLFPPLSVIFVFLHPQHRATKNNHPSTL